MNDTDNLPANDAAAPVITDKTDTKPSGDTLVKAPVVDKLAAAPADWPEDWREKMASGDEKLLGRLKRFNSPNDVTKSWLHADKKISEGAVKVPLPENATPEQLSVWRKDNGIPEAPEGYDLALDGGYVVGEADKPLVGEFVKEMHGVNADPRSVKAGLTAYYKILESQQIKQAEKDTDFKKAAEDELRTEWGGEFRSHMNGITSLMDQAPAGVADNVFGARLADGTRLGDNPAALRWLAGIARELNPAASVVPGSGRNADAAIADEMKALEAKHGTMAYSDKDRARYVELTDAQMRITKRAS